MAMSGIAYFVQRNTGFKYLAGLWQEMLAFNLLWTVTGEHVIRRTQSLIPSWSWASVNGHISHRLKSEPPAKNENDFSSPWKRLQVYLQDEDIKFMAKTTINELVLNATLRLHCVIFRWPKDRFNVLWDVAPVVTEQERLAFLPTLSFDNDRMRPKTHREQTHGLVSFETEGHTYARVGYFWTTQKAVVDELFSTGADKQWIELV